MKELPAAEKGVEIINVENVRTIESFRAGAGAGFDPL
jgi:hypothetical protein